MKARARNGISRPSAQHLRLPLVDHDPLKYTALLFSAGKESNLLTVPSSHWTMTAGPNSSASMYSQESYINSPPVFSESRLDRRRFGVALSSSLDGPWRQVARHTPNTPVFVLHLPNEKSPKEELKEDNQVSIGGVFVSHDEEGERKENLVDADDKQDRRKTTGAVGLKKMYTTAHSQASRSTKVFGKMLLRKSTLSLQGQRAIDEKHSPHTRPELPPQILISVPSPGLGLNREMSGMDGINSPLPKQVVFLANPSPRNPSTLPSTWKPKRPPSPLPRPLRKKHGHTKRKRSGSHAPFVPHSPLPPLPQPLIIIPASPLLTKSPEASGAAVSSFYSLPITGIPPPRNSWNHSKEVEDSIGLYLKARATKTATYAIHNGGIISPP